MYNSLSQSSWCYEPSIKMFTKVGIQRKHGAVKRKELQEFKGRQQELPMDLVWKLARLDVAHSATESHNNLVPGTAKD